MRISDWSSDVCSSDLFRCLSRSPSPPNQQHDTVGLSRNDAAVIDGQNRRGIEHHEIEKITQIVQQAGKSGAVGQGHGALVVRSLRPDITSRRFIQDYGLVQRALSPKKLGKAATP